MKRKPRQVIHLDSPSPLKRSRRGDAVTAPQNPSMLPGLQMEEEDFPEVGEDDGLEEALGQEMDKLSAEEDQE